MNDFPPKIMFLGRAHRSDARLKRKEDGNISSRRKYDSSCVVFGFCSWFILIMFCGMLNDFTWLNIVFDLSSGDFFLLLRAQLSTLLIHFPFTTADCGANWLEKFIDLLLACPPAIFPCATWRWIRCGADMHGDGGGGYLRRMRHTV